MAVNRYAVRPLADSDVDAVLALERDLFPEPWTDAMLSEERAAEGRTYLVATDGGVVVAYGGVMVVDTDAHIMTIGVADDHQGSGVGSRIMLGLIDAALEAGAEHLTLEVRVSNERARRLYEKFGFSPVGIRPRYYRDEDALVMWALDVSQPAYRATLDEIRAEAA